MASHTLQTERFGEISVEEAYVLRFVEPILGFPDLRQYVLLEHAPDSPLFWLQSMEEPALAFVVTNPAWFDIPYDFLLPEAVAQRLGLTSAEQVQVLTIVNVPDDDPQQMTTNLLGPIIIHRDTREALQVVLTDSGFTTRVPLLAPPPPVAAGA